jgi:hypothetical protein
MCWLSRQGRYSGLLLFRAARKYFDRDLTRATHMKITISQLFQEFRMLNCNLSDSLKNLPTLFRKWFEYFHQNKS